MKNPNLSVKTPSSTIMPSTIPSSITNQQINDNDLTGGQDEPLSPLTQPLNNYSSNNSNNNNNNNNNNQNDHHQIEILNSPKSNSFSSKIDERNHSNQPQPPPPSRFLVFLTVSFYLVAALVMVFVNKWVLNSVPAPVFFLFCQLLIAVILLKITSIFGFFQVPMLNLKIFRSLIPLISINVLGLVFNTYCLQYVDASFYQVARGLILPFTVLASYLILGTKSSSKIHVSIFIVCLGFMIGVSSERMSVSSLGVFLGVLSSITTSLHAIVVKSSLKKVSTSTLDLTYFTNLLSSVVIIPLVILMGELPIIFQLFFGDANQIPAKPQAGDRDGTEGAVIDGIRYDLKTFLIGTFVTGFFGFLISLAGFLSIKVTSPVTHMISSAVRGVIQTGLGALIFKDKITIGRLAGITIILGGSIYYTFIKDQELYQQPKNNGPKNSKYESLGYKDNRKMVDLKNHREGGFGGGSGEVDEEEGGRIKGLKSKRDVRGEVIFEEDDDDDEDERIGLIRK